MRFFLTWDTDTKDFISYFRPGEWLLIDQVFVFGMALLLTALMLQAHVSQP